MRPVVIDFETYFDQDYTLSKLSTEAYIRDKRFEALGASIKWGPEHLAKWYDARFLQQVLKEEDWSDVFLIAHHAQFDGFILSQHYRVFPKMWGCTLSMARMVIGTHLSASLDSVRSHYGIDAKRTPYNLFKGKHWKELTWQEQELVAEGCCDETESVWKIFCELAKSFPPEEYEIIDTTVRMFSEPKLAADVSLLGILWERENTDKRARNDALQVNEADLQSSARFRELLEAEGIEIEEKEGKNGLIPAFAKTDEFMRDLLEHPNGRIRGLAEARLGVKSTLLQTRAETLGWMASRGPLPVYLRYCLSGTTTIYVLDSGGKKRYKTLDTLSIEDKVWDGQEFVSHQGLFFQGYRETVDWEGLSATADHRVWEENGQATSLGQAKSRGIRILGAPLPGGENWELANNNASCFLPRSSCFVPLSLWKRAVSRDWQFSKRAQFKLQALYSSFIPNKTDKQKPWQSLEQYGAALYQFVAQTLASLWRAWNQKQIFNPQRLYQICFALSSSPYLFRSGNRPYRQQRTLRAGKSSVGNSSRAVSQYGKIPTQTRIAVYDIFQCGPCNRFWANGKLVSNCGAHTSRWSGGDGVNFQNLKRDSDLRRALLAPPGYYLGIIDLAQIECRILNYLAGQEDVVEKFRTGQDPYIGIASQFYGRDITRADQNERGTGKQAELSCGYGCGQFKFQATAKLGIYGPPVHLDESEAKRFVDLYRETHPAVVQYWRAATRIITRLAGGPPMDWGPMVVKEGKIYLPNGVWLDYTTIDHYEDAETGDRYWRIKKRHGWTKLYGGKLVENVVQALARVVLSQAMIRICRLGYRILATSHDEILILIPNDGRQENHLKACADEMVREPTWLPGIPLAAESTLSERYSK